MKIFRLTAENPLLWQLTFSDAEVDKIIANRYTPVWVPLDVVVVFKGGGKAHSKGERRQRG